MTAIEFEASTPSTTWSRRTVVRDGIRLAVFELGEPADDRPTVILVHGWPDTHLLWTQVAADLASRYHVVAYDTRGYGESDRPTGDAPYRLPELAADLFEVIDAVSPGRPAHVVAHDWGSIQTWEAVTTPDAEQRIASFVSVSGPNLDHLGLWTRERLRRPTPKSLTQGLSQALSSAYTVVFQLPVVPKVLFRIGMRAPLWRRFLTGIEGTDPENMTLAPTFRADAVSGLRYYRANIRERLANPDPRRTQVPVFEVVNTRDVALRKAIFVNTHRFTDQLWRMDTPTGHWLPYTNPAYLAEVATQFIETIRGGDESPGIARARQHGEHRSLGGKLAVITGAGSAIGRETAHLLAENGAEVIAADINLDAAEQTAAAITSAGGRAHAYVLDVTDDDAFANFVEQITKAHGVADVVINNAEIGVTADVLDVTEERIQRLVDINVMGVVTGSRVFGRTMVERGLGGHIVNLASAATFASQEGRSGSAAPTSAVLMFSESLRAELAEHRIGVSAINPARRRAITPDRVAAAILRAIVDNKPVVPVARTKLF